MTIFYSISGADLGGALGARPSPRPPNFEAQILATAATPLRDVGKILLGPPLTQIVDPHLYMEGMLPPSALGPPYCRRTECNVGCLRTVWSALCDVGINLLVLEHK